MQELPDELKEFLQKHLRQLQGESLINRSLFNEMKECTSITEAVNSEEVCKRMEFVLDFAFSQGRLTAYEEISTFLKEKFGE